MADRERQSVDIERIDSRAIVSLRLAHSAAKSSPDWSAVAGPLRHSAGTIGSLWLGPNQWLLVSDEAGAVTILDACREALGGVLHHAVDQSAAFAVYRLSGAGARALLASGCGLDLRLRRFPDGSTARTRLAQIAAVIVARQHDDDGDSLEVYLDRSHAAYFGAWLMKSSAIPTAST